MKKLVLDEYEICLEMLEMALLETQIFKNLWGGGHAPRPPPRQLAPLVLVVPSSLESPGSAPV